MYIIEEFYPKLQTQLKEIMQLRDQSDKNAGFDITFGVIQHPSTQLMAKYNTERKASVFTGTYSMGNTSARSQTLQPINENQGIQKQGPTEGVTAVPAGGQGGSFGNYKANP